MAKKIVSVALEIEIDEEAVGKPAHIWAYHFFTRLGYEYPIKSVKYGSEPKQVINSPEDLTKIELRYHDSMKKFDRKKVDEDAKKIKVSR